MRLPHVVLAHGVTSANHTFRPDEYSDNDVSSEGEDGKAADLPPNNSASESMSLLDIDEFD